MKKIYLFLVCLFIFAMPVFAKKIIELKSGERITCEVVSEDAGILTVISDTFGEMKIKREDIKNISELDDRTGYKYDDPNHNSLLFMPSAETNPKGTKYISSYELFYINTGYAPVENLHISLGFLFPIVPEMITEGPVSIGVKYRTVTEPYKFNMSVMGSYTTVFQHSDIGLITYGTAYNYYFDSKTTANLYFGGLTTTKTAGMESIFSFGLGLTFRTSESSKFLVEYLNGGMFDEIVTDGIILFGLRFFGERISADLAGIKFLDISGSEPWFLIPLVSLTYHW
jgi:hypothetical protein